MLTTKVITPRQGESYYAKENYYSAEESVEHSQWAGIGAKELGLKGKVKPKDFKRLLYGELPNGTQFRTRKKERAGYKERAGLDCTFSAPKSVSLLALVAGEQRLEEAHQEAVLRTLAIIEREYATTRASRGGKVQVINTGNLVVGQFHHDTSRELDPHLHTHCVVLNMTQLDNRWYSFRNDDLHANKKLLGMIYQNELALQVKKLGYRIEAKEHGQFEIKGFATPQLESFSKRRQQIKAQIGEESDWKERELVWDKTRIAKREPISRDELQSYWKKELEALAVKYPQTEPGKADKPKLSVKDAVDEAVEHCSERTVAFKPEAIQKFILNEVGNYRQAEIEGAIANDNELIHLDGRVTTQTALMRELATIRLMEQGKGQVKAITNPEAIQGQMAEQGLTEGQQNAVTLAATTSNQFVAWQGKAGAGKTHALNEFKKIAQDRGYMIKGFAPSAKAAKVLEEELKINYSTVARHLVSKPLKEESTQQQIWIVDEAGLLSAKDALALLERATQERARILLVGDTKQLSSVEAGNPFKSLQQAGMTTAYLNQSLRQKTQDLKQAVELLSEGHTAQGIEILDVSGRIEEVQEIENRAKRIATDYLQLSPSEREQTLIIAGTHQEREEILHCLREGLKQEGTLGEEASVKRLKSKNLTAIQKKYAHYYQPGDVVIPMVNYKRLGLEKGKQYQVESTTQDRLSLSDDAGNQYRVDPAWFKYKEVYEALETEIAVGDRLRWGKNDQELNRTNGEEFVVTRIDQGTATIRTESGTKAEIDLKTPQHVTHNLVSTTYSSQGATANRVLVSATNDRTLSKESFYVAASRAKYNLHLYVENRAKLVAKATESRTQLNPIELLQEQRKQEIASEPLVEVPFSRSQSSPSQPSSINNYERTQLSQPDLQKNPRRSSDFTIRQDGRNRAQPKSPTAADRTVRREPPELKRRARQLFEGINQFVEQEEVERIAECLKKINQHLRNRQFSVRRTEDLRKTIKQFHQDVTTDSKQQRRKRVAAVDEKSTNLTIYARQVEEQSVPNKQGLLRVSVENLAAAINETIEQSTLDSNQILSKALEKLQQDLENWQKSKKPQANKELKAAVANYVQRLDQQNNAEKRIISMQERQEVAKPADSSVSPQKASQNPFNSTIEIQLKQVQQQLNELASQKQTKKRQREQSYLEKTIKSLEAFARISPGQVVTKNKQKGNVTEVGFSPGGMAEVWVKWENYSVPMPERPELLELISSPQQNTSIEKNNEPIQPINSRQSEPANGKDIGGRTVSRLETSSREIRRDRGSADQPRIQSSSPNKNRTINQSAKRPTAGLQRVSGNAGDFKRRTELPSGETRQTATSLRREDKQARPGVDVNVGRNSFNRRDVKRSNAKLRRNHQDFRELTNQARSLPLEEVAERLGLERDHYDKHKWRGDAHTLSINDQKFYDHLAMKGSGGAIDLVMHVRGVNFKEAVGWLGGQVQHIPYRPTKAVAPSRPHPHPPFRSPVADETKWLAVKEYLVKSRGIPETLVNQLHEEGKVYADSKQNAVFLRQNPEGKITGASLRGTYQGSQFKGLATGTRRERGWFSITQGEGKLKRIVLTESPIDTLSAATVAQKPERTIFLSTDGAGTAPTEWLREQSEKGVQIIAAHDRDHAGEYQAWSIAKELTEVGRVAPKAKDWNEQLLGGEQPSKPEPQDWKRVAQALGKSDKYTARINKVIANVNLINSLSDEARQAMQEDFEAYQETTKELWQWHQAAKEQEKPQAYLERISEVALKFHSPNNPVPLSIEANRAMQYDLLDQKLREQYLDFKAQAKQNPNLQNSSSENIDITIALLAIRKNSQIAQNQGKVFEQVSNLLSQSDQVKDWKRSLPKGEYLNKAKQYIDKLYEQASQLGQDLSSKKQNEQLDEIER